MKSNERLFIPIGPHKITCIMCTQETDFCSVEWKLCDGCLIKYANLVDQWVKEDNNPYIELRTRPQELQLEVTLELGKRWRLGRITHDNTGRFVEKRSY